MLYETDYWFWKSSIPSNLCDDIVQHGLSKQESKAWTGTAEDPTPEPGAEVQGEGPEDATEPGDTGEPADL